MSDGGEGTLYAEIFQGNCVELMAEMPENSIDAIVTDPPYGLEFMGKDWDKLDSRARIRTRVDGRTNGREKSITKTPEAYIAGTPMQAWHETWAREALRVLKPGGHLLAFGGTRTYHRLACAIEDAGFEIRDCIAWMYAQGFPKSLDVSKAIDKAAGAKCEVVGSRTKAGMGSETTFAQDTWTQANRGPIELDITTPFTADAKRWEGWGTALKPAHEPIVVARKPLIGTVAKNVVTHSTGALNIDASRIELNGDYKSKPNGRPSQTGLGDNYDPAKANKPDTVGRWPANVILDEEAGALLDAQTGTLTSGKAVNGGHKRSSDKTRNTVGSFAGTANEGDVLYGDSGGASRFFYCAKAGKAERNAGLEKFEQVRAADDGYGSIQTPKLDRVAPRENWTPHKTANGHPTVKPLALMRYLVRLITPPGGIVLDPFTGSGTTGCAAVQEGFDFIGLEMNAEYAAIAEARIAHWAAA